jgi:hypothetical protein
MANDAIANALAAIQASQPNIQKTEQPTVPKQNTARQEAQPPAASRSTPDVQNDATVVCADIRAALASLPDENRLAVPAERDDVWNKRRLLNAFLNSITSPLESRVAKLDRRIADRKHWHAMLTAMRLDLEKSLAQIEAAGRNSDYRLDQALRVSLRMIQNGADPDEMFATPLMSWLQKNGIFPLPGTSNHLAGRGGLRFVESELVELDKERDEIIGHVETALVDAKQLLASISASVTA